MKYKKYYYYFRNIIIEHSASLFMSNCIIFTIIFTFWTSIAGQARKKFQHWEIILTGNNHLNESCNYLLNFMFIICHFATNGIKFIHSLNIIWQHTRLRRRCVLLLTKIFTKLFFHLFYSIWRVDQIEKSFGTQQSLLYWEFNIFVHSSSSVIVLN